MNIYLFSIYYFALLEADDVDVSETLEYFEY